MVTYSTVKQSCDNLVVFYCAHVGSSKFFVSSFVKFFINIVLPRCAPIDPRENYGTQMFKNIFFINFVTRVTVYGAIVTRAVNISPFRHFALQSLRLVFLNQHNRAHNINKMHHSVAPKMPQSVDVEYDEKKKTLFEKTKLPKL